MIIKIEISIKEKKQLNVLIHVKRRNKGHDSEMTIGKHQSRLRLAAICH